MFTLQDPTALSHCNDPLHKLRWDRNTSTGQAPLLKLYGKHILVRPRFQVRWRFEVHVHQRGRQAAMNLEPT